MKVAGDFIDECPALLAESATGAPRATPAVHNVVGARLGIARANELSFFLGVVATVPASLLNKARGRSCIGEILALSTFL